MEKLPEELRLLVVERMSPIEDLASLNLRLDRATACSAAAF